MKTDSIIVVGGGSAGWMTAATLIKAFPNKKISVIESPDVPIVGVGESTLGQINEWLHTLGIEDDDWMEFCDASLKASIKFTDFKQKGEQFHYPFGWPVYDSVHFPNGMNDWFIRKVWKNDISLENFAETFFPATIIAEQNKIIDDGVDGYRFNKDVAYHFDATKFGAWLRDKYCIPKGVKHISSTVTKIYSDDNGIKSLVLSNYKEVSADMYIDCTGWKSILMNELKVPFESYSDILPNDSAWATRLPFTDKQKELEPYTNCTAIQNGWVWNIPLWSRTGTGYVYSSKFIDEDSALEQFKNYLKNERAIKVPEKLVEELEYRPIKMRIGIHDKIFEKNVCAIGLSAGFIEPLESNGLFTVHEFLNKLVLTLRRDNISQFDKDSFNDSCRGDFRAFAEFVALHYRLSQRDDTPYWRHVTNLSYNKIMPTGIYSTYGFENLTHSRFVAEHFDFNMGGNLALAVGMGYLPMDEFSLRRDMFKNDAYDYLEHLEKNCWPAWDQKLEQHKKKVEQAPTLYEYLERKYNG